MASQRLTVALLTVCVASGVGGALLAAGVLTSEDEAPDAVGINHDADGAEDPSAEEAAKPAAPPTETAPETVSERAPEARAEVLLPDEPPRQRVRELSWDTAREMLGSRAAWQEIDAGDREKVARRVSSRLPGVSYQRFETFSGAGRKHHLAVFHHQRTGLEMVLLPGGTFTMGSPEDEPGRSPHEPGHEVTLSPFLISRTEVTQSAWLRVYAYPELMPSRWRGPDLPIETISRDAAAKFCERASGRLPTEAEWEFACRAGGEGRFWFGDDEAELPEHAWVRTNSGSKTHPVGLLTPNPFGLFDVHGNVWEWVSDKFGAYTTDAVTDPRGAKSGTTTIRGGSYGDPPFQTRCANRLAWSRAQSNVGFRLAKSIGD